MSKETYIARVDDVRAHPTLASALIITNRILTGIGYIAYPLLLILLFLFERDLIARCIAVPAAGFIIVSAFRYLYNEPRPYETYGFAPIIDKDTSGKSFPSRHTFCMFMIACSWAVYMPWAGAILALSGCAMAAIRVCCGVHYVKDIVAGVLCAVTFAVIGYCVIPIA